MLQEKIERINFLAKKAKTEGLTEEEKAEQAQLRGEYIAEWREGVIQTLENTYVVDENGKRKLRKNSKRYAISFTVYGEERGGRVSVYSACRKHSRV